MPSEDERELLASTIERFADGTAGPYEWDDIVCTPFSDPELEALREEAEGVDVRFPPTQPGHYCSDEGVEYLRTLVGRLRGRARIMRYVTTTKATDFPSPDWKDRFVRVVPFFIPRASPDHEVLYPHVRKWLIEIDGSGEAHREIGLDHAGTPLFAAPDERNVGFWTDAPYRFTPDDGEPIGAGHFEALWQRTCRDAK